MRDPVSLLDKTYNYKLTLWLSVGIFLAFIVWASLTEINQQVHGAGRVIPSGKIRQIQHLEGGIITSIDVSEGQTVKAGDTLFSITNKRAEADSNELQISIGALKLRKIRLTAEMNGAPSVTFDPELEKKHPDIAATERSIFESGKMEFDKKIDGLQQRQKQKVLRLGELATTVENLKREASVAKQQLAIRTKLRNSGAISQSQYLETESQVRSFQTQISRTEADIPITRAELAEIQNLIDETRKTRQTQAAEELNKADLDINRQLQRAMASRDQVDRTVITSPVDGVVNKVYVNTIGGVVKPGETVADVIPVGEKLLIEGRISTKDRGKIWLGLPVIAKISAYDYSIFGGLNGELSYISADSFVDNRNNEYYQVRVTVDATALKSGKPILPGMTADLNILAGKISVLKAIFKPFWNIKDNALTEK